MAFIYIVQSKKNGRLYVGSTTDIERRMYEHNIGKTKLLRALVPVVLLFKQEFSALHEARTMEYRLKRYKSRKILEKIIRDQVIKRGL